MMPVDWARYDRQTRLAEVGRDGQLRLSKAKVLLVGVGGLGAPAALYLAAAGVGTLGLLDFDAVDVTNLHRQVLYTEADIGRPKVLAAADHLRARNSGVEVYPFEERLTAANALQMVEGYDVVLDGTDTFETRYLVNDACVLSGTPNVFASVSQYEMQMLTRTAGGPCYRCVFPEPPPPGLVPSCADGGVLGVVPGLAGVAQAAEALKLILNAGSPLVGRLSILDVLTMTHREIRIDHDPDCPVCGSTPTILSPEASGDSCTPPSTMSEAVPTISPPELREALDGTAPPFLIDVRNRPERALSDIGGAWIPLPQLSNRFDDVTEAAGGQVVVYCRSGARSRIATEMLRAKGVDAVNLSGGLLAWREEIDPSLAL